MCSKRKKKSAKRRGSRHRAQPRGGEGPPATPNGVAGSPSKRLSNGVAGSPSKRLSNGVAGSPKRQSYASALGSSPPRVSGSPKSARGKLSLENELLHSWTPNGVAGSPKSQSYASAVLSFPRRVSGSPKSARGSVKREAGETGLVAACPPPPSKDVYFTVLANHFGVKVEDMNGIEIWQYIVTFTPKLSNRDCDLSYAIMRQLFDNYRISHMEGKNPVFDGLNRILTNGRLPFSSNVFDISLEDRDFKVKLEVCKGPNIVLQGTNNLYEVSWAINKIIHQIHYYNTSYVKDGRALYSLDLGEKLSLPGVEFYRGFYQSIRPTQMGLSLNVDICSTGFFRAGTVLEFIKDLLQTELSNRHLTADEMKKIKSYLQNLKIRVIYGVRRQYSISDLSSSPALLTTYNTREKVYVPEYFKDKYNISLEYDNFPCLRVEEGGIFTYLPVELCTIEKGQRSPYRLHGKKEIRDIRKYKVNKPDARKNLIVKAVVNSSYGTNDLTGEFKLSVSETFSNVQARLLPEPKHMKRTVTAQQNHVKDLIIGGSVDKWCCIVFSKDLKGDDIKKFCNAICTSCVNLGMKFKMESVIGCRTVDLESEEVEDVLRDQLNAVNMMGVQKLDLLIAILPDDNVSLYGDLKRICETKLGIVSQCFKIRTFHNVMNGNVQSSLLETVAFKINAKLGGKNSVLVEANSKAAPGISMVPTIIFGADVTHYPSKFKPSIAAVVASQDWPDVSQYASVVRSQAAGKEIIQGLRQMIKELLVSYTNAHEEKRRPERIIYYRDGVGESEFSQLLSSEFGAIKKACEDIAIEYNPPVTFVLVQKRHHTRMFVGSDKYVGSDGNILPGTVVNSKICHPEKSNFYLCSHTSIRGTVRPTHYTSLHDENNFTTSELERLTYDLCYTYARCTAPVSLVPPVYYAHLAAYRARSYWEPDGSLSEPKKSLKMFFI